MEPTTSNASAARAASGTIDGDSQTRPALVEIIHRLAERHANGVLRLGERGDIWFADGRITLAVTGMSGDLAQVLVDADLGDEAELRTLVEGRRQDDESGVEVVLDQLFREHPGSHERIQRLLHEYKLNSLFAMLVPGEVVTDFEDGVSHPIGPRFGEHAVELIDKALDRIDLWRRIAACIPTTTAVFRLSDRLPDALGSRMVTGDEWRYLARLDGSHTIAEVISVTGDSAFRVCSALYRLMLEGLIVESGT